MAIDLSKIVKGHKNLFNALDKLKKSEASRLENIHLLAVSCLSHANEHGDLEPLTQMYLSLGKSADRADFIFWIGVMSIPDVQIVEGKPQSAGKQKSMIDFERDEKRNFVKFIKRKSVDTALPGSMAESIKVAAEHAWWDLEAVRIRNQGDGGNVFKPDNDAKAVIRSLGQHAYKAEQAGYPKLAAAYRSMIEEIGAIYKIEADEKGKVNVEIASVKRDLFIEPKGDGNKPDHVTAH